VGVIDYGMGNLHSVAKALDLSGGRVTVSDSRTRLGNSQLLVLPGVGAFGAAMETLARKRLDRFIQHWLSDKKPYLGICLGFQLLFEKSEESPGIPGLGFLSGSVRRFRKTNRKKNVRNIPHMGWNQVKFNKRNLFPLNKKFRSNPYFYFVHTFYPEPKDKKVVLGSTSYGENFCSAVAQDRMLASQFHPEKSGEMGLTLLKDLLGSKWMRK